MKDKRECICFAYFADGKFIGWYADSFGSIRKNSPKIYDNSESQISIIEKNFRYKISSINEKRNLAAISPNLSIIDNSLNNDSANLAQYKNIELRIVPCPIYDGPNPEFDSAAYESWYENELREKGPNFKYSDCPKESKYQNWIYCDYTLVKEWASNEPTEFLKTITI